MKTTIVRGQRIAFVDEGDGPPVLLLHGLGVDHSVWGSTIADLKGRFRLIAPDLLGHGQSARPDIAYRARTLSELALGLIRYLGLESFDVVGNSLGGWLALLLARDVPDRIRRVVAVAPAFGLGLPEGASAQAITQRALPTTARGMEEYLDAPPRARPRVSG